MVNDAVTGAILVGIPLVLLVLRTQAAMVVLSLYAGVMVSRTISDEALAVAAGITKTTTLINDSVAAALFLIPAIVLAAHYRKSAGPKLILQIPPILFTGFLILFLGLPLLSSVSQEFIKQSRVYQAVDVYEDLVVVGAVIIAVLVCVALYRKPRGDHEGKHGKHKK